MVLVIRACTAELSMHSQLNYTSPKSRTLPQGHGPLRFVEDSPMHNTHLQLARPATLPSRGTSRVEAIGKSARRFHSRRRNAEAALRMHRRRGLRRPRPGKESGGDEAGAHRGRARRAGSSRRARMLRPQEALASVGEGLAVVAALGADAR